MSVLNKKPFIQSLIASLSSSERESLLSAINGSGATAKYSLVLRDLTVSTPIERCLLETKTHIYNAYKVYKSGKVTFLTYGKGQEMGIYQVSYPYYERELKGKIGESLDINELRRYLESIIDQDGDGSIDSGSATEGQVLTADGQGGATWESLPDMPKRYQTSNIESLNDNFIEKLQCGDIIIKKTGNLYHTYIVTHRQATGICLSYFAAGYSETISYDKVDGSWVFNSKDVWQAPQE